MKRQVVLDTETTGLDPRQGHRIIEVGCVELVNRSPTGRYFHEYFNPERLVEEEALAVHGITQEFLKDKPLFSERLPSFLEFISGAELIIHNADFDVSFLNYEFSLITQQKLGVVTDYCGVLDTLALARKLHPGQRNSLDALCKRYYVNNSHRDLHGGLLDARILAEVYLAMTGGQVLMSLIDEGTPTQTIQVESQKPLMREGIKLNVVYATPEELSLHEAFMGKLAKAQAKRN